MEYVRIPGTTLSPSRIGARHLGDRRLDVGWHRRGALDPDHLRGSRPREDAGQSRGAPRRRGLGLQPRTLVAARSEWQFQWHYVGAHEGIRGHAVQNNRTSPRTVLGRPVSCLHSRTDSQAGHRRFDPGAFGRKFLANADLPERFRLRATLNVDDQFTYCGGGAKGHRLPESRPGTGRATETLRGRQVAIVL